MVWGEINEYMGVIRQQKGKRKITTTNSQVQIRHFHFTCRGG